jgi:DsbC/DsbD-like thiol-disulfide interchange protein
MVTISVCPRLALAAWLLCAGGAQAAEDVSRWDGDDRSAARLIAGLRSNPAAALLRAGVELRLKRGWHTYWRYPGDAGVPPQFDFQQSKNVKSVEVLWPAPQRLAEAGGVSIGYERSVIFPLRVMPQDPGKPVAVVLKLDYAICEKLCVPAQAHVELALSSGPTSQEGRLEAAEARVPQKRALGEPGPLVIATVHREAGALQPRIAVDVAAPGQDRIELFAEGPTTQWALPVPEPVGGAPPGQQRFVFDLDGLPTGTSDHGAPLTLTAVTPQHTIEVVVRLD